MCLKEWQISMHFKHMEGVYFFPPPPTAGGGGVLDLYKCQLYRNVPLTWVGLSAILVHAWVVNLHIFVEFHNFGILMGRKFAN